MRLKLLLLLLYVKTSLADDIQSLPPTATGKEGKKKIVRNRPETLPAASAPSPVNGDNYNFGYEIGDGDKSHKFHKEVGDGNGRKIGSYGFTDADGRQRVVQYVADENGFRVQIKTNEPGTNSHQTAASLVQKRPTIVLLDDKDSPMTLPVKTSVKLREPSVKLKGSLFTASSFHAPVLPNGPVRMYETGKSVYFSSPASQSIEYKPHPKAIQIGPLLNIIGTPITMPMQSPILPLGPVKVARYDPTGPLVVPLKYQAPIPIPNNYLEQTPLTVVQHSSPTFEPLRISSTKKQSEGHPSIIRKENFQANSPKFDPSKFNILSSMYQTTLLPNGPKMYDGPVHAYVRAPLKSPPPNRLIYDDPPKKSLPRRKVLRKKKLNLNSDEGLQTTENGLELSQTIRDQSTVFYVPAEHAPPVRRRLAKPIFKKKRQPLQHGDGTPARELNSPLTGSKPVVYDDPVGDLKPVPLFEGSSVTGFLPPPGKLAGPSEAYKLVRPPKTASPEPSPLSQPVVHSVVAVQASLHDQATPVAPPRRTPTAVVVHKPTPQLSPSGSQTGLIGQSYPSAPSHLQPKPLYQTRLKQPATPQFQSVLQATPGTETLKIPLYPKLTEIERAAALKLAQQPLHIQLPLKEVPLQAIDQQRRPELKIVPQQREFPRHHVEPETIHDAPAPNLGYYRQSEPVQFPQASSPSGLPQTPLQEYFAKQAPTFLQNQEAIVSKFTNTALTVPAPRFEQYKTTEASFKHAEANVHHQPQHDRHHQAPLYTRPPQVSQQLPSGHAAFIPTQLASQHLHSQSALQIAARVHPRPHIAYHQGTSPDNIQGPSPQASLSPETFNDPPTAVPPPSLQPFSLTNQGPGVFQEPQTLQDAPPSNHQQRSPSIVPPSQPPHIHTTPERYAKSPQIPQSPFPAAPVSSTQHAPSHPSQHLPSQVLPPHYQQPPVATFQPQHQTQQHPPTQLLQTTPQHLSAPQQVARAHGLQEEHSQTLQTPLTQQLSHTSLQHLQGGAPSLQHLLPPNLQQPLQALNIGSQQHLLTHGRSSQYQVLAQPIPQHIETRSPPQFRSIPQTQLFHSTPSPSAVSQLGPHVIRSTQLQHQPAQLLQSQPLLHPQLQEQPVQFRPLPLHFEAQQGHISLQPQASSQEDVVKTTNTQALQASVGDFQAQTFVAEPSRRPKSLADHSPFEYIKKSSR
ncbi:proline-rich extensin-like protein EPR1 isoform X2 [Varroa jacobsoni]|uniref:Uncharacterized protein n=2 Tax=Varroa TaxID=62624 RepID=A0A7M7JL58_VARDE|nr:proline-rich extensin-like protein EPR1 [Varroa destructor]XP_022653868.1 proline-rich extensin-like protein EPR1 [Varroa destructor]XP_022709462.1 proline-rich extensin-like protein EPR1 isoform X2 [Varroa jacobsoni]